VPADDSFRIERYLDRVGLSAQPDIDLAGLSELVRAQHRSVAFENLSPITGTGVALDHQSIWDKIVVAGRGGYCFELNYLLGMALDNVGLGYTPVLARVMMGNEVGGPKTHLLFIVSIDGSEYLVDVGFGGPGLLEPMPLVVETPVEQGEAVFRLIEPEAGDYILQRSTHKGWFNVFTFNREVIQPVDVIVANHFTSTWVSSPFKNQLMCAYHGADGLMSFRENSLVTTGSDLSPIESVPIEGAGHLERILVETFGLKVDADLVRQVWEQVK